ncbi:hypothetical protein E6W39_08480 [Kitasatospora acidiphila]|uniref:Excreted virulence factor EspC (Type VII ESX diderm) n=1 Tax=Kitasatospora acidiphila TaxID=2567942 RepID=A0A540VZW0_9ACTN|nr:hypothetical protein [Kitasatospora acidiphila]TQF02305.1 hypothetical protein E6W39_08480 [Kitasatospora acidiphila]
MNDINIHPDNVRASAGAIQDAAGQTGIHHLDDSFTVAAADSSWQTAGAVTRCATAWQGRLTTVTTQLQQYADQLKQSADSYDAANTEAVQRLQQAFAQLNGG